MEQRIFVLLPEGIVSILISFLGRNKRCSPPLNLHDAVEQPDDLLHAALLDEGFNPRHRLVTQQQPQLVQLADFDELGLLCLSQVRDVIPRALL